MRAPFDHDQISYATSREFRQVRLHDCELHCSQSIPNPWVSHPQKFKTLDMGLRRPPGAYDQRVKLERHPLTLL